MSGPRDDRSVLIVARRLDDHLGLVEPELAARGARVARLNTEEYVNDHALVRFRADGRRAGAVLQIDGGEIAAADVGAVLYRRLHIPTADGVPEGAARELAESELRAALEGSLLSIDAHWLDHPNNLRLARYKLLQLRLATDVGLTVPESLVTSDPAEIRALFAAWDGAMIAKLVGGQVVAASVDEQHVVYTTLLEEADLAHDEALSACPALYQRLVDKAFELRVQRSSATRSSRAGSTHKVFRTARSTGAERGFSMSRSRHTTSIPRWRGCASPSRVASGCNSPAST